MHGLNCLQASDDSYTKSAILERPTKTGWNDERPTMRTRIMSKETT